MFRAEGTSRWAMVPPSDLLTFIDLFSYLSKKIFIELKEKNLWKMKYEIFEAL